MATNYQQKLQTTRLIILHHDVKLPGPGNRILTYRQHYEPAAPTAKDLKKMANQPANTPQTFSDLEKLSQESLDYTREHTLDGAIYTGSGGLTVIVSLEDTHHGVLLHASLSYRTHNPSWEEIKRVRAAFFPDYVDVAMMLPSKDQFVNVHNFCFQMWQLPEKWGIS